MIHHEDLYQKLVDLEKAKIKEKELRFESEKILESLQVLTNSSTPGELFKKVFTELQKIMLFNDSFVLKLGEDDIWTAIESTNIKFLDSIWKSGPLFNRTVTGNPSAVFNINQILEWQRQPYELKQDIQSALHIYLNGVSNEYLLICTHREKIHFNQRHIQISKRFTPFLAQILATIELRKSVIERDRFFTISSDLMCIIGFDGYIQQLNDRWKDTLGYDNSYLMSQPVINFIHFEDVELTLSKMSIISRDGARVTFENRFRCNDGSYKNLLWRASSFTEGKIFYAVATDISERKKAEREVIIRNEIMEKDLQTAQKIQDSLIGKAIPENGRLSIDYRYYPLEAVGGDFFSFTQLNEGGLGLFIGDVCGHGVSAALFLSLVKFSTDIICRHHAHDPGKYMEQLNIDLYQHMPMSFATALYGFFDLTSASGTVGFTFARGGHPFPIVYNSGSGCAKLVHSEGKILGVKKDIVFGSLTIELKRGDRIFFYTDGVSEARKPNGELIMEHELISIFENAGHAPFNESLDMIMNALNTFQDNHPYEDDVVLIGVEVK